MNKEEFVEMIFQEIHKKERNLSLYKGINHSQYFKKAEKKLENLHAILEKVDDSDFAKCQKCGKPILIGSLIKRPECKFCMNCAI